MNPDLSPKTLVPHSTWLKTGSATDVTLGPAYLLLITLLAGFLRFYMLTGQSLWIDEIMTWQMIRPGAGLNFVEQIRDAIQGPLYMAITWPLLRLSDSAFMLRLPLAIAGTLTVPLFALTVQSAFNGRSARLAGLLLALSPFHVWYSQEGRGYALLLLFAVAMGAVLLKIIQEGWTLARALVFALCSAGAAWSNMSGLFLWAAMGLGVLIFARPRTGREWAMLLVAFGGGALAVVPWILKAAGIWAVDRLVVGSATGEALRGETTFTPLAIPYSVFTFFFGYSYGPSLRELHEADKMLVIKDALPWLAAAAIPVVAGLGWGLLRLPRRAWAFVLWILVPVLVLVFLAMRNFKPWNPRYVAVVFPWLLAVLAHGLTCLPRRPGGVLSLLLAGLFLFSLWGHFWNERYAKADVRTVAEYVMNQEDRGQSASGILVPAVAGVFNYYYQGPNTVLTTFGDPVLTDLASAEDFLNWKLEGLDEIFFLEARSWYFDPEGVLLPALAKIGEIELEQKAAGVRLYSWQRRLSAKDTNEH